MQDLIGLILCNCGGSLEDKIDFDYLIKGARRLSRITMIKKVEFLCRDVMEILEEFKGEVGRVLFACCSERSSLCFHEEMIEKYLDKVGMDRGMYEVANIREQCAWMHTNRDRTTRKAMDLITMAYEKLKLNSPAYEFKDIKQEVLVIGGGVAGISAAQALSKLGVSSTLVEERPYLGGHAQQVSFLWQSEGSPGFCHSECVIPVINRDLLLEERVSILTNSSIKWIEKRQGNFYVEIECSPRYVDASLCVSCGRCREVCPVEVSNEFELAQKSRKAIDKICDVCMPDAYNIDASVCNRCGECVSVCPTNAIDLDASPEMVKKEFGAVVFATGFNTKDMKEFPHLAYERPNVITLLEFERMIGNRFYGRPPMSVTFVLCQKDRVGYCSRLCCEVVAKHAYRMSKFFMGTETLVIYKDLRTAGRLGEVLRRSSEEAGVEFIRAEVKSIEGDEEWLTLHTDQGEFETQLVVLAEPLIPSSLRVAKMLGLQLDEFGFPVEFQPKVVRPLQSYVDRVFLAGAAKGFKDVQESIESGNMAALRAYEAIKGKKERFVSVSLVEKCSKCGMCIPICPHGAISAREKDTGRTILLDPARIEEKDLKDLEIGIDPAFCKACGMCYTTCPSRAIRLLNLEEYQILKMAERAFENMEEGGPRILAFLCYWCSYGAADMAGIKRMEITENFRTIRMRCSGSVSPEVLTEILFEDMADGILVAGCPPDNCHHLWGNYVTDKRVKLMQDTLSDFGIDKSRLRWEYIGVPQWDLIAKVLNFMDKGLRS